MKSIAAKSLATVLTLALLNMAYPMGAITLLAPDPNAPKPAKLPPVVPVHSRMLSAKDMKSSQGRLGVNPYIAGSTRWSLNYKGIDLLTGNFSTAATDLTFEGGYGIPVEVTRAYSANNPDEGPFGYGWTLSAEDRKSTRLNSSHYGLSRMPSSA